jgi:hypothetical protein
MRLRASVTLMLIGGALLVFFHFANGNTWPQSIVRTVVVLSVTIAVQSIRRATRHST